MEPAGTRTPLGHPGVFTRCPTGRALFWELGQRPCLLVLVFREVVVAGVLSSPGGGWSGMSKDGFSEDSQGLGPVLREEAGRGELVEQGRSAQRGRRVGRRRVRGRQERTGGQGWAGPAKRGLGLISEALGSHQGQRQGGTWPSFCLFKPLWLVCGKQRRAGPQQLQEPPPHSPAACPFLCPLTWPSEGQPGKEPRPSGHPCPGQPGPARTAGKAGSPSAGPSTGACVASDPWPLDKRPEARSGERNQ